MANKAKRHPVSFKLLHEIIMWSIILMVITGFYIHRPYIGGAGVVMSIARGVHTFFAVAIIIATVSRVIAMFFGRDRDWKSFIPSGADLKLFPRIIGFYAYISDEPDIKKKYNPLQMVTYCLVFLLIIFQILSGIALKYPDGFMSWWNYGLFNNEVQVRVAHFIVNWLFVLFVMIHVYLTVREKFGEIKQMHLLSDEETEEA